jgi:two-component system sensor histidine kinase RpfC
VNREEAAFDIVLLRELTEACSRPEFVETFVRGSLRDAGIALERLSTATGVARWDEARDRAHAIKGIAANIGALRIAACADRMMRRSDLQMPTSWPTDLERLRDAFEAALAGLDTVLRSIGRSVPHE